MYKMTAAVAYGPDRPFSLEPLELGEIHEDEVLVRIQSCGICHTDVLAKQGVLPFGLPAVLGHEGAGVVERVGSAVRKVKPGDHVVLTFDYCTKCPQCTAGHPAYCVELMPRIFSGRRMDGTSTLVDDRVTGSFFAQSSFATRAIAREANVVPVPADVDLALLGQLGCGIQTGAGAVLNRLRPKPGTSIVVTGVGPVGMAAIMAAKVIGCSKIIAVDIKPQRLSLAFELGATHVINSADADQTDAWATLASGLDFAVDTTARQSVISQAFQALGPGGTLAMLGAGPETTVAFGCHDLIAGGRTVCGVSEGDSNPDIFIPQLIDLYKQGVFPLDRLVTRYPFEAIESACAAAATGEVIKPVIIMN